MRRHQHSLSHYRLTTLNMGQLVPICMLEVLPGDSFRHRVETLVRVAPLVTPVMHPVELNIKSFFVPNRILWSGWEQFITGQVQGGFPTIAMTNTAGSLTDYLEGFPGNQIGNALPFRAYNRIWNEFFRDQDLQPAVAVDSTALQRVAWGKDEFTTARTAPQQGQEGRVSMRGLYTTGAAVLPAAGTAVAPTTGVMPNNAWALIAPSTDGAQANVTSPWFNLEDFRVGMSRQRIRENRNKYGSRYVDYLRFLGIRPSDARLQRPELLSSDKTVISFSEVLQTAPASTPATFVGDMAGHGIAALRTRPYKRFFEEHGIVLTLAYIRPKNLYISRSDRLYTKIAQNDYWQKEDEMLGDQVVWKTELGNIGAASNTVFGYQDRHYEYRRKPNSISGSFATVDNTWHLGRNLGVATLNASFLTCTPPNTPFADTTEAQIRMMVSHQIQARRLVSSTPRI